MRCISFRRSNAKTSRATNIREIILLLLSVNKRPAKRVAYLNSHSQFFIFHRIERKLDLILIYSFTIEQLGKKDEKTFWRDREELNSYLTHGNRHTITIKKRYQPS